MDVDETDILDVAAGTAGMVNEAANGPLIVLLGILQLVPLNVTLLVSVCPSPVLQGSLTT